MTDVQALIERLLSLDHWTTPAREDILQAAAALQAQAEQLMERDRCIVDFANWFTDEYLTERFGDSAKVIALARRRVEGEK